MIPQKNIFATYTKLEPSQRAFFSMYSLIQGLLRCNLGLYGNSVLGKGAIQVWNLVLVKYMFEFAMVST